LAANLIKFSYQIHSRSVSILNSGSVDRIWYVMPSNKNRAEFARADNLMAETE